MATDTGTNASSVNEPPNVDPGKQVGDPQTIQESRRLCAYWKDQLEQVKDEYRRFEKRGRTIEKRYRDERNRVDEEGQRRYNSLWSNVQVLFPALYARPPVPVAERRFRDRDPVGRNAASILERGMRNEIEINGLDQALELAVLDYLLPGRGAVWVRYEPEFEESVSVPTEGEMEMRDARGQIEAEDDSDTEEKLRDTGLRVVRESAPVDYVPWSDFFTFPAKARTWREVVAVGKRVYMTRDQMVRRFGELGKKVPMEKDDRERRRQNESVVPDEEADHKGQVYEIWDRGTERAYWLAEGFDQLLDRRDDPLQLDDFFPVPRPLYANPTTNTLVPVADYMEYQDQAIQIDELTQRISQLSKACKVAGVYNAQAKDIQRLLDESVENELIPVDNWAAFAGDKGGVAGQLSLLPLKEIIGVLNELVAVREKIMADMDRLTGVSDVMRGTTDERETTMGGQRLKVNAAGTRISKRQAEVARFCRDTIRLVAQVMCTHFSPKSLIEASGALHEEGLGGLDPDVLSPTPTPAPQPVGAGGPAPAVPPLTPAAPGPAPIMRGGAPPPGPGGPPGQGAPPPGSNVVPLRGPQQPSPAAAPLPVPAGPPSMGGAPGAMALPPEMQEKFQALQRIGSAIALLRDEKMRGFRVDIEIDSTIFGDAAQEKADRTEFLEMTTQYLQTALQMGAQVPQVAPLLGKFLQFGVRGFRVGRDLEQAIEDFVDEMEKQAKQRASQPPQPSPEQVKAQAQMQGIQAKAQIDQAKNQAQMQQTQMQMHGDQIKAQAEMQRQQVENQGEMFNSQADLAGKQADLRMRELELEIEKLRLQAELAKAHSQAQQAHAAAAMPKVPSGIA